MGLSSTLPGCNQSRGFHQYCGFTIAALSILREISPRKVVNRTSGTTPHQNLIRCPTSRFINNHMYFNVASWTLFAVARGEVASSRTNSNVYSNAAANAPTIMSKVLLFPRCYPMSKVAMQPRAYITLAYREAV